ncbi:N-isopropylammelide isopropyl amidohydrolase [Sphingomonas haloaromaticamans]|uniref:N-isopropylammelide isopropyl amidohydrolase n=1 Tax=Edaphosphingomonas haloaromaticamans TaxID=653954 RepID=A0A1S1HKD3_9SPHN|nr:N-isopropylammelide isopropyl amidohydrolase [Sphingomonas haloaromaticamans]
MNAPVIDTLFTNARLADGSLATLAVAAGRFVSVGIAPRDRQAAETVDLGGRLVLPGFVDGHIHLDKSFVGDRWHPHRPAATLRERLANEKALLAAARPVAERAEALIALAAGHGTMAMRSHVDVDATTGLANLHAVMEAREHWAGRMAIELVAFPQAGILTCPGTADILDAAIREGADVIGGIDPTTLDGDADGHLDIVFGIADRRGAKVDIHLHEPGEGGIAQLGRIAERTAALGLNGRVAVSHAYALGDVPGAEVDRIAERLATAGVAIMTNAPGDRAFPPIARLRAAGVTVFAGNDNIRDAWWPYGDADMLRRAMLIGYRSGFYTDADLETALDMASGSAARVLGLDGYGIAPGCAADFVAMDAPNAAAAVAGVPAARQLFRKGKAITAL